LETSDIILELIALEEYFKEGLQRCYSIRKILEQFSAPAPSGVNQVTSDEVSKVVLKRKEQFYKSKHKKTL
jgi:hypothetical protein